MYYELRKEVTKLYDLVTSKWPFAEKPRVVNPQCLLRSKMNVTVDVPFLPAALLFSSDQTQQDLRKASDGCLYFWTPVAEATRSSDILEDGKGNEQHLRFHIGHLPDTLTLDQALKGGPFEHWNGSIGDYLEYLIGRYAYMCHNGCVFHSNSVAIRLKNGPLARHHIQRMSVRVQDNEDPCNWKFARSQHPADLV